MKLKTTIQNLRLSNAITWGETDRAERSILSGADVNKVGLLRGTTPLMRTKLEKDIGMGELLERHGAKLTPKEKRLVPALKDFDRTKRRIDELGSEIEAMSKDAVARVRAERRRKRKQRVSKLISVLLRREQTENNTASSKQGS